MSSIDFEIDFVPYGDQAVLININDRDLNVANQHVVRIINFLENTRPSQIIEWVPAYDSITLVYNIYNADVSEVKTLILDGIQNYQPEKQQETTIQLPICYDDEFALDIADICHQSNLTKNEVIQLHSQSTYKVYMTGFMPGFIYLGELPIEIQIPRKDSPRKTIPSGSVGLAGQQTGIYSVDSPGGWQIIGRSINILGKILDGSLTLQIGDKVSFYQVTKKELKTFNQEIQHR